MLTSHAEKSGRAVEAEIPSAEMSDMRVKTSRALDQWRGLALSLVLISHGFFYTNLVNGIGRVGVNLFFFISGILVFRSLSSSRVFADRTSRAFDFWRRRWLRLFPALLAYIVAITPIVWIISYYRQGELGNFLREVPYALLFTINYRLVVPATLGHLWSVAVEMQFYVIAPAIFFAGGQSKARRSIIWSLILAVLMMAGIWSTRSVFADKYAFFTASWPMMLGLLMEALKVDVAKVPRSIMVWSIRLGVLCFVVSSCLAFFGAQMKGLVVVGGAALLLSCFFSYLLGADVPGASGRVLQWLGKRTYSIYLWQDIFTMTGYLPHSLEPLGSLVSTGLGGFWYKLFEKPFLSAGRVKNTGA